MILALLIWGGMIPEELALRTMLHEVALVRLSEAKARAEEDEADYRSAYLRRFREPRP